MDEQTIIARHVRDVVANYYGFEHGWVLNSKKRNRAYSTPRKIAGYLLRVMTGWGYLDVATAMNRTNHATAMYWVEWVEAAMKRDPSFAATVDMLRERVRLKVSA